MKEYGLGPNNEILKAAVRNQVERTGHSLEFHPTERVGLVSGRIRRLIKKAFHIFSLGKESHKFNREFNVELHGTDDDRELMARYNARREDRSWRNMTAQCQDFARQFTRHRSKDLVMIVCIR